MHGVTNVPVEFMRNFRTEVITSPNAQFIVSIVQCPGQEGKHQWPGITIVLPVKGCRKHSLQNWQSQLQARYSGPVEYLFVVDSQVRINSNTGRCIRNLVSGAGSEEIMKIQQLICISLSTG